MRRRIFAAILGIAGLAPGAAPARNVELSEGLAQLYTSVSIHPPTAERMTVCYGFVCRRRYIWSTHTANTNTDPTITSFTALSKFSSVMPDCSDCITSAPSIAP